MRTVIYIEYKLIVEETVRTYTNLRVPGERFPRAIEIHDGMSSAVPTHIATPRLQSDLQFPKMWYCLRTVSPRLEVLRSSRPTKNFPA